MHRPSRARTLAFGAPARTTASALVLALVLGLVGAPAVAQDPSTTTTTGPATTTSTTEDPGDPPKTEAEQKDAEDALRETLEQMPEAPDSPDDPFEEAASTKQKVEETALARMEATAKADAANLDTYAAATALAKAKDEEILATAVRDDAKDELADERERLSDLTVRAYVTGGEVDVDQYQAFVEGDTTDPAAGRTIMFNQVLEVQEQATKDARDRLDAAESKLDDVQEVVAASEQETLRLTAISNDLNLKRMAAEKAHVDAVEAAEEADQVLRTAVRAGYDGDVPLDTPIIGLPRLTPDDLALWFAASSYRPRVTTPIADYARWFIEEGLAEGIRGDIAFAQAVIETGGFTNTDSVEGNNFSGIGHYDNLARGWSFPSPRLGVRAQIQLLKSYAIKKPHYANPLVDKRLRGPAGCCDTWGDLTRKWATSPIYGPVVMGLYTQIVDFALARRARGEGFSDAASTLPPPN